jgi:hypothetical protein
MNYFWKSLFEAAGNRDPMGVACGILLKLIAGLAVVWVAYLLVCAAGLQEYLAYFLAGIAVYLCVRLVLGIQRLRARARDRYNSTPLSRDEIAKAKTKLAKRAPVPISKRSDRAGKSSRSPTLPRAIW